MRGETLLTVIGQMTLMNYIKTGWIFRLALAGMMNNYQKAGIMLNNSSLNFSIKQVIVLLCLSILTACSVGKDLQQTPATSATFTSTQPSAMPPTGVLALTPRLFTPAVPNSPPSSTLTPRTTASPSPSFTPLPSLTPSPDPNARIGVVIQLFNEIVLGLGDSVEVLGQDLNFLYRFKSMDYSLVSFSPDGCFLRAVDYVNEEGKFIFRELDLHGAELNNQTVRLRKPEDGTHIYQYVLSPDGSWLAYKAVGDFGYGAASAKVQDVRLVNVDPDVPQAPIQLTKRGGAGSPFLRWSPDSRYIAFSDTDAAGINQLYLYEPVQEKEYQLTQFDQTMSEHEFQILSWSPDSKKIAFSSIGEHYDETGFHMTDIGKIGIISLPDFTMKWVYLSGFENPVYYHHYIPDDTTTYWWSKDSQSLLIPFQIKLDDSAKSEPYLAWYNLKSGAVTDILTNNDFPDVDSFWGFPLDGIDIIGFYNTNNAIYIYNRVTHQTNEITMKYYLRESDEFLVPPYKAIEPGMCRK